MAVHGVAPVCCYSAGAGISGWHIPTRKRGTVAVLLNTSVFPRYIWSFGVLSLRMWPSPWPIVQDAPPSSLSEVTAARLFRARTAYENVLLGRMVLIGLGEIFETELVFSVSVSAKPALTHIRIYCQGYMVLADGELVTPIEGWFFLPSLSRFAEKGGVSLEFGDVGTNLKRCRKTFGFRSFPCTLVNSF